MKTYKKFLSLVILLLTVSHAFAVINDRASLYTANYVKLPTIDYSRFNSEDVETLVSRVVPEEVKGAFLYYTTNQDEKKQNTWRLQLLAGGYAESEWRVTRSHDKNADGSYDYGYLMLNENNFTNKTFLTYYVPNPADEFTLTNKQEWYVITCINFFKDLYSKYGCDAWYCYNAGETRYRNRTLPIRTLNYKKDIAAALSMYLDELYAIADARIAEEKRYEEFIAYITNPRNIMDALVKSRANKIVHIINGGKWIESSEFDIELLLEIAAQSVYLKPTSKDEIDQKTTNKPIVIYYEIDDDDAFLQNVMSAYRGDKIPSLNAELVSRQYNIYI